jgi:hypothetical protein
MVGPYDSRQEWIANNVFYEPPKVGVPPVMVSSGFHREVRHHRLHLRHGR